MARVQEASVHGRFQPFHNAHLKYVQTALERADRVYIGLTRVFEDVGPSEMVAPHRLTAHANPFSYYQRRTIIRAALEGDGIDCRRIDIGPFPIEMISKLPDFWPVSKPCFTTTVDEWNDEKIALLQRSGYEVSVIKEGAWTSDSMCSGTKLREMMREGNHGWKAFVPAGAHVEMERMMASVTG